MPLQGWWEAKKLFFKKREYHSASHLIVSSNYTQIELHSNRIALVLI